MKIGYIRVSSSEQNLARQIKIMKDNGIIKVFSEKKSGKNIERSEFQKMMKYVRKDDEIVVTSLDRLGRNYEDIKWAILEIQKKGVFLTVLDAPFLKFNTGNNLLDRAMKDMFLSLLSYIAQNEREKILERQRQGIEEAKLRGVYKGRPIKYHKYAKKPKDRLIYESVVTMAGKMAYIIIMFILLLGHLAIILSMLFGTNNFRNI